MSFLKRFLPGGTVEKLPERRIELVYDGLLPERIAQEVLRAARQYPFCLELSRFPSGDRMNDILPDASYVRESEDCMGQTYVETRPGVPFLWVAIDFLGPDPSGFLMLRNSDGPAIADGLGELVIDRQPFKTRIVT